MRNASKPWSGSEAYYARLPEGLDQGTLSALAAAPEGFALGDALVFEDCGYPSSMDQPQAVTALLLYWLQNGWIIREGWDQATALRESNRATRGLGGGQGSGSRQRRAIRSVH